MRVTLNVEEAMQGGGEDDESLSITSILKSSADSCEHLLPEAHVKPGVSSRSQSRAQSRTPSQTNRS